MIQDNDKVTYTRSSEVTYDGDLVELTISQPAGLIQSQITEMRSFTVLLLAESEVSELTASRGYGGTLRFAESSWGAWSYEEGFSTPWIDSLGFLSGMAAGGVRS